MPHRPTKKTGEKKQLLWKQTIAFEKVELSRTSSGSLAALFSWLSVDLFMLLIFGFALKKDPLPHF